MCVAAEKQPNEKKNKNQTTIFKMRTWRQFRCMVDDLPFVSRFFFSGRFHAIDQWVDDASNSFIFAVFIFFFFMEQKRMTLEHDITSY